MFLKALFCFRGGGGKKLNRIIFFPLYIFLVIRGAPITNFYFFPIYSFTVTILKE